MERVLVTKVRLAIGQWWLALGIMADDDGLEADLLPAAFAIRRTLPTQSSILIRSDA